VYNHEERLTQVLDDIRATLTDGNYEIIVVYDVTKSEMIDAVTAPFLSKPGAYGAGPRCITREGSPPKIPGQVYRSA